MKISLSLAIISLLVVAAPTFAQVTAPKSGHKLSNGAKSAGRAVEAPFKATGKAAKKAGHKLRHPKST